MSRKIEVEIIAKKFTKLYAEDPSFREERASLFHMIEKISLECVLRYDDRFAEECPIFRPSYRECISRVGYICQSNISSIGSKSRSEARSIDEKQKIMFFTDSCDGLYFMLRIESTHFRRI